MIGALQVAFAGVWPLVGHYAASTVGVLACFAYCYFSPINKAWGVWAALVIIAGTVCYGIGVSNGMERVQAQWDAANEVAVRQALEARANAEHDVSRDTPASVRNDPHNRDAPKQ